jgi:TorA maturation chaperone TorD
MTVSDNRLLSPESRIEQIDLNKGRASTYALLSRLFRIEVDESLLFDLRAASFPAKTGNESVDRGYREIATFLSGNLDLALLELAKDYARTFIGHGNNAYSAAYPFESVYTSEKRLIMQEARDEVMRIYAEAGLDLRGWKDPEDHIALELEYMKYLSEKTVDALEENDDTRALDLLQKQQVFIRQHLGAWLPMMIVDMRRIAKTDFYQGLASLTEGYLALDEDYLNRIITE